MTAVRNVFAIVEKEWRHYFGSPIAWVALFVWAILFGIFFSLGLSFFVRQSASMQASEFGPKLSLNDYLVRPVLQNMAVVALFVAPMLTMRLFAEEKRQGTIELLATSPITDFQIVLGKFLAAAGLYLLMILSGAVNLLMVWAWAANPPEWRPVLSGVLGLLLFGCCFLALGTFVSTLTRNQIVAGILSFCLFLGVWALDWFKDLSTGSSFGDLLGYLSLTGHLEDLAKGVVDLKDLVYYLSVIAFGLFLAHQSVESQRWRA